MKRVLIVEPDSAVLDALKRALKKHVDLFEVLTATRAKQAIDLAHRSNVNLVVTALALNDMPGQELMSYLNRRFPQLKLMVMLAPEVSRPPSALAGIDIHSYISKPVKIDELEDNILQVLQIYHGGMVHGISIASFLQLLEMEVKTCRLQITSNSHLGQLFIEDGELVAAQAGSLKGEAAAHEIIGWDGCSIGIDYTPRKVKRQIDRSLMSLLMEARTQKDESAVDDDERREHPRFNCLVAVEYDMNDWSYQNFIRNLSLGGAFIETEDSVDIGQRMMLNLTRNNSPKQCTLTGRVVRRTARGVGIAFDYLSPEQMELINSFLD